MKILFDHQAFNLQKYGGISRYFLRLAEEINRIGEQAVIFSGFHINAYLKETKESFIKGVYLDKYPKKTIRAFSNWNKFSANIYSGLYKPDLIHETYFSSVPFIRSKSPVFVTVYDMIQEIYTAQFPKELLMTKEKRNALNRADHIFSISHHTKRDVCNIFEIPEKKVSVVHLAADLPFEIEQPVKKRFGKPFILFVGLRLEYKNFKGLVRAFAASDRLKRELNLIAFGGNPFTEKEKKEFSDLGLQQGQVIQMSGSDKLLAELYSQAEAFVYPSLYEGFGIPPLEAMSYQCPVISSNTSSMPEIIGNAGLFFDPLDIEQIKIQIENSVFDSILRQELITRGNERKKLYSWSKTAEESLRVYKKILG